MKERIDPDITPEDIAESAQRADKRGIVHGDEVSPIELVGMKISVARRRMGFDLNEFASKTNLDRDEIIDIEIGNHTPDFVRNNAGKIDEALDLHQGSVKKLFYDAVFAEGD